MATGTAAVGTSSVSVVVTNADWERHLRAWAEHEAELRRSAVQLCRPDPSDPIPEAVEAVGGSPGGLVVVGPVDPRILTELVLGAARSGFHSPVVVVRPPGGSGPAPTTAGPVITVGFHGSPCSEAALRWAVTEAVAHRAAVRAVMAWSESRYGTVEGCVYVDPHLHALPGVAAAKLARRTLAAAGLEGRGIRPVARRGAPARVLVDEAAGSDLLVVGSGRSTVHNNQICGSSTLGCVYRSPVPVVIVPRSWPE